MDSESTSVEAQRKQKGSEVRSISLIWWILMPMGIGILFCGFVALPGWLRFLDRHLETEPYSVVTLIGMEAKRVFSETCELPSSLPTLGKPEDCCGLSPFPSPACDADDITRQRWLAAGFDPPKGPFIYAYETERIDKSSYVIRSVCLGDHHEPVELILEPDYRECSLHALPLSRPDWIW